MCLEYMTKLSQNINIFNDEGIMRFLKKNPSSFYIQDLSNEYERNQ